MSRCKLLGLQEWPEAEEGEVADAWSACEAIGGCGQETRTFFEEAGEVSG